MQIIELQERQEVPDTSRRLLLSAIRLLFLLEMSRTSRVYEAVREHYGASGPTAGHSLLIFPCLEKKKKVTITGTAETTSA